MGQKSVSSGAQSEESEQSGERAASVSSASEYERPLNHEQGGMRLKEEARSDSNVDNVDRGWLIDDVWSGLVYVLLGELSEGESTKAQH